MIKVDELEVGEVYTPTQPARKNFVERAKINKRVIRALKTPGMQVILYGHSGSGKTTLLVNKLSALNYDFVKTNCTENMTFESLMSDVLIKLDAVIDSSQTKTQIDTDKSSLGPRILNVTNDTTVSVATTRNRVSSMESIELSVAKIIGETEKCWVIEDFHKLKNDVKRKLAQLMKVFMDLSDSYPNLKIIALGAKNTAREVVQLDSEMQNRVSEIYVPLMDKSEIEKIVTKGCSLLNIDITKGTLEDVIEHSNGVASICHHLCLLMCESISIEKTDTMDSQFRLDFDDFNYAVSEYIEQESDTLKSCFQSALKINNSHKVIQSLVDCNNEGLHFDEIKSYVDDNFDSLKISSEELKEIISKLTDKETSYVLMFDDKSDTYCFRDPFHKMFAGVFLRERQGSRKLSAQKINEILNAAFLTIKKQYDTAVPGGLLSIESKDAGIHQWDSPESEKLASKFSKSRDPRKPVK
ncbi:AAA family ATPase [Thalassotalea piscium]